MIWTLLFGGETPVENETDWRGIGFALFGGAALVFAIGYALTKPAQMIIEDMTYGDDRERHRELMDVNDVTDVTDDL